MKIADIRREFLLLEHMHDLDKRLLRVFELGAREGASQMAAYAQTWGVDSEQDVDALVAETVKHILGEVR